MKNLIFIALITFSLSVLINCSPKVATKTAASQQPSVKNNVLVDEKHVEPIEAKDMEILDANATATSTPFANTPDDEQIKIYNEMAPLRAEIGKKLVTVRCGKCHDTPQAMNKPADAWIHIMKKMGPKAKLNTDEYLEVSAYLVQNAKK